MKIETKLLIDFTLGVKNLVTAVQGDLNTRYLTCALKNNGVPLDLTGYTVKIYGKRPENPQKCDKKPSKQILYDLGQILDATNGKVQFPLKTEILAIPGYLECEISVEKITKDAEPQILTSPKFKIIVSPSLKNDGAMEATNEFGALVLMFKTWEEASDSLNEILKKIGEPAETEPTYNSIFEALEILIKKVGIGGGSVDFSELIKNINNSLTNTEQTIVNKIDNSQTEILNGFQNIISRGLIDDAQLNPNTTYSSQKIDETYAKKGESGSGGGAIIDDGDPAPNKVWSSEKVDSELPKENEIIKEVENINVTEGEEISNTIEVYDGWNSSVFPTAHTPGNKNQLKIRLNESISKNQAVKIEIVFGGGEVNALRINFAESSKVSGEVILGNTPSSTRLSFFVAPEQDKTYNYIWFTPNSQNTTVVIKSLRVLKINSLKLTNIITPITDSNSMYIGSGYGAGSLFSYKRSDKKYDNVAVGINALQFCEKTYGVTAVGAFSLQKAQPEYYTTAIGWRALKNMVVGFNAVAVGAGAASEVSFVRDSIVIGKSCASSANSITNNSILISSELIGSHISFSNSIIIGDINEGDTNAENPENLQNTVVLGKCNGRGYNLTCIGDNTLSSTFKNNSNIIAIGNRAGYNASPESNVIFLGDNNITKIYSKPTVLTSLSDRRVKKDVTDANLDICYNKVKGTKVTHWAYEKFAGDNENDKHRLGFVAQDVQEHFPKAVSSSTRSFPKLDEQGNHIMKTVIEYEKREIQTFNELGEEITQTIEEPIEKQVEDTFEIEDCLDFTPTEFLPALWGAVQKLMQKVENLEQENIKLKEELLKLNN